MKMEENSRNMQTIQNVPLFSCLTNKQKAAISDTIKVVVFSESDVVFRAGDDSQAIYIIS
jgi:signal-transduction protein with cAMP-binding, CBS, and nucleotidyltransferase domain